MGDKNNWNLYEANKLGNSSISIISLYNTLKNDIKIGKWRSNTKNKFHGCAFMILNKMLSKISWEVSYGEHNLCGKPRLLYE